MSVPGYVRLCHSWRSHIPSIMKRLRFVSIDALCQDRLLRLCQVEGFGLCCSERLNPPSKADIQCRSMLSHHSSVPVWS